MAKVWFARRDGAQWVVPGGRPAFEMPLEVLIFKLDLGPQRYLNGLIPTLAPGLAPEPPESLSKILVEVGAEDLERLPMSVFRGGFYDSPFSPREGARRIAEKGEQPENRG
jgi:hypothetical protein